MSIDARLAAWGPRVTALAAFVLFAVLAPPGPAWLDAGELGTAGVGLGVPHASGYPLWCVLAKVASLLPLGELAWRIHLLSALTGALAVLWTARLVIAAGRDDAASAWGGVAAGALLAVALLFLRQATVTEVYAPSVALLALAALGVERVGAGAGPRWGLGLAMVCGLGLAIHLSFAWIGPVVAALMVVRLRRGARFPLLAPAMTVLVACGAYAYLPARAAGAPAIDVGHPRTLGAMIAHVAGDAARTGFTDRMLPGGAALRDAASRHATDVADSLGPLGVIAALAGLAALWRRRRTWWTAATVTTVAALDAIYAVWINPSGLPDWQCGTPLVWAGAVAAGAGVAALTRMAGRFAWIGGAPVVAMCVLPAAALSLPAIAPASRGDAPRGWSEAALAQAPAGALVVPSSDSLAFGLIYLTRVEGARPDLAIVPAPWLDDARYTRGELTRAGAADLATAPALRAALAGTARAILIEPGAGVDVPGRDVVAAAPLTPLAPPGATAGDPRLAGARAVALLHGADAEDRAARVVLARALTSLARLAGDREAPDEAAALLDAALAARPGHGPALVLQARRAVADGDLGRAARLVRAALADRPRDPDARALADELAARGVTP